MLLSLRMTYHLILGSVGLVRNAKVARTLGGFFPSPDLPEGDHQSLSIQCGPIS